MTLTNVDVMAARCVMSTGDNERCSVVCDTGLASSRRPVDSPDTAAGSVISAVQLMVVLIYEPFASQASCVTPLSGRTMVRIIRGAK
jgi:hypothetical protein